RARGRVLGDEGQGGEREGEQVGGLVTEAGALAGAGLEPAGDLAEAAERGRQRLGRRRPFAQGVAGVGAGLDGIGLLVAEEGSAVVLVALGIAAGEGQRKRAGSLRA